MPNCPGRGCRVGVREGIEGQSEGEAEGDRDTVPGGKVLGGRVAPGQLAGARGHRLGSARVGGPAGRRSQCEGQPELKGLKSSA